MQSMPFEHMGEGSFGELPVDDAGFNSTVMSNSPYTA